MRFSISESHFSSTFSLRSPWGKGWENASTRQKFRITNRSYMLVLDIEIMITNLDMDALRTFVLGIDLNNFSRAADQLGRSQSAISMQLKKLEQQVGRPLLTRHGRGLITTEAGDLLLGYARRILALNDEAATSLGATATPAALRIGLPQDFFEDVMPEVLRRFAAYKPNVHIEVRAGRNHILEDEVRAGRLDAAITFCRPESRDFGELVAAPPLRWYDSTASAGSRGKGPLPLVLYDHPCLFRQAALAALDACGHSWRMALTTPSLSGVWAAV
ncbi:MAG TPA: LysR family transcriptional regulator, partial [Rhabdaerophilum sp.]|nr:LysR family transcriptional regulator [Rhabdaerophilum sp.]